MLLILFCLLVLSSICFPRSKGIMLLWGLFLVMNVVCTSQSSDAINLEIRYTSRGFADLPILFRVLMKFCSEINLSFLQFKFAYICIVAIVLMIIVHKGTVYTAFCMMLVSVYPGWCFSGQIRYTIGAIAVIFTLNYLIRSDYKYKKLVYISGVITASLVHPACIIYLLIIFCIKKQKMINQKIFIGYVALLFLLYTNLLYRIVSLFMHDERVFQYLKVSFARNPFGSLMVTVGQLALTYFTVKLLKRVKLSFVAGENVFLQEQYDLIIRINYALLLLVPFYGLNHAFFRIYKYLMIINYCFMCKSAYNGRLIRLKNFTILLAMTFFSLAVQVIVDSGISNIFTLFDNFDINQLKLIFSLCEV